MRPPPPSVQRALRSLGRDIRIARKKRRMPVADFATRMGVAPGTLARLEKGEPGVSVGALAMALLALGELRRLDELIDVSKDDTGLMLDIDSLPQRIRSPRATAPPRRRPTTADSLSGNDFTDESSCRRHGV